MNTIKIYLAGSMEHAGDGGAGWRRTADKLLSKIGYTSFNPCTDEGSVLAKHGFVNAQDLYSIKHTNLKRFLACMRDIKNIDIAQLAHSDYVLVYINKTLIENPSGTIGELTCASNIFHKKIIAFVEPGLTLSHASGWMLSCIDHIAPNLESAIAYIQEQEAKL